MLRSAIWDLEATSTENYERFKTRTRSEPRASTGSVTWSRFFIDDSILADHDRALVLLAQSHCPMDIWKPILLWHMTRDEFLVRDFVVRWLIVGV